MLLFKLLLLLMMFLVSFVTIRVDCYIWYCFVVVIVVVFYLVVVAANAVPGFFPLI